ncbi:2-dehydro-3-deoxygalactonokinase [Flavitalea antarctica]
MTSPANGKIFSCDWGTSNFRLRLIDIESANIIDEIATGEGISTVFNSWSGSGTHRHQFYAAVLQKNISIISGRSNSKIGNIPVLISGMASSTLGITELPYAALPLHADGSALVYNKISVDGFPHDIFLISGVSSENDVMRGEETQWIGLMQHPLFRNVPEQLFILPGTHSKHILVKEKSIVSFKTYMTGEFFNLLSTMSVLKNSVSVNPAALEADSERDAFIKGVRAAAGRNLLHESFMVRTNELFGHFNKKENASYLSGLLIGSELLHRGEVKVVLAAGDALARPYQLALEHSGIPVDLTICSPAILDKSVIMGQLTIFKKITGVK